MTKQAGISGGEFHNSPVIINQYFYEGGANVQRELETICQLLEGDDVRLQQQFENLKVELEQGPPKKDRKAFWEGVFTFAKNTTEIVASIIKIFAGVQ